MENVVKKMKYLVYIFLAMIVLYLTPAIINQTLLCSFLYVDYSLNNLQNPDEFPKASAKQYVTNYARELFYSYGKFYNKPIKYLDLTIPAKVKTNTAILLVHGFGRNQGDYLWLRKQFAKTKAWVFTVDLIPPLAGIDEIASASIVPKIKQIKQVTGCQNIIIIGASMGGVVASYYKEYLDEAQDVKAVITIGSPLHGTKVAVAAPGINSRQMCPDSEFLAQLRQKMNNRSESYYQVVSKFDEVIFPWESALLQATPKQNQYIVPFVGHLGMLHDGDVAAKLNHWVMQIIETT